MLLILLIEKISFSAKSKNNIPSLTSKEIKALLILLFDGGAK